MTTHPDQKDALLACPMCGNPELRIERAGVRRLEILCTCGVRYSAKWLRMDEAWLRGKMIEHWNRRATLPAHDGLVARLNQYAEPMDMVQWDHPFHGWRIDIPIDLAGFENMIAALEGKKPIAVKENGK